MPRRFGPALAGLLALAAGPGAAAEGPTIAVASSLRLAMPELAEAFAEAQGRAVEPAYGASGALVRQIRQGAAYELFLAANSAYPQKLVAAGLTVGDGKVYARGRLGLFVPAGSPLAGRASLDGLRAGLADGSVTRFAIANPRHAPYGERARSALQSAGLWQAVQPALVLGQNAAQAAQFAASGNSAGGLVPASLAAAPRLADTGTFQALPERLYTPLPQRVVRLNGVSATARAFYRFLDRPAARRILRANGFAVPDGTR